MKLIEQIQNKMSLSEIQKMEEQSLEGIEENGNRLKVAYALVIRIEAALDKLKVIRTEDFPKMMQDRLASAIKEANEMSASYKERLALDNATYDEVSSSRAPGAKLSEQIESLLQQFEELIRKLVDAQDKLPFEEIVKKRVNE